MTGIAKNERKNTRSPGRDVRGRGLDADRHPHEERAPRATFRPMPRSGLMAMRARGRRRLAQPRCPSAFAQARRGVERRLDGREHLVDLGLGDRHRRAEAEGVADRAADDAALDQLLRGAGADLARLGEAGLRAIAARARARPSARDAGPRRRAGGRRAGRGERRSAGRWRGRARGMSIALVDLDRLDPDRAGDRVAAVGVAVAEGADPAGVGLDRLGHACVDRHGRERQEAGGELLGDRDERSGRSRAPGRRTTRRCGRSRRSPRRRWSSTSCLASRPRRSPRSSPRAARSRRRRPSPARR